MDAVLTGRDADVTDRDEVLPGREAGRADARATDSASTADAPPDDTGPSTPDAAHVAARYACGERVLSPTQIALRAALDRNVSEVGTVYAEMNNRAGALGNSEPAVAEALLDAYVATNDTEYLRDFVVHGDLILSHRDDHAGYVDYRGRSVATWSDCAYATGGQCASFLIEDGALIAALAHFSAIVRGASCLAETRSRDGRLLTDVASMYVAAAGETVSVHVENWHTAVVGGLQVGYFTTASDAPFIVGEIPGKPVPLNYHGAVGAALAHLYASTQGSSYRDYAVRVGNMLLREMAAGGVTAVGAYRWPLWPQLPGLGDLGRTDVTSPDDLSHATITVEAVRALHEHGLGVFYTPELERVARAFSVVVYTSGPLPLFIDGTGPPGGIGHEVQFARVAMFAPHEADLWSRAYELHITRLGQDRTRASSGTLTGLARLLRYAPPAS